MSKVLSATVEMKDPEKFKEYSPKAIASMEPYGGKLMLRAKVEKVILGPIPHQVIALFEFPDSAAIDSWYNSAEYKALISLRDEDAVIRFAIAESFWLISSIDSTRMLLMRNAVESVTYFLLATDQKSNIETWC